jgi:hypothetical protein
VSEEECFYAVAKLRAHLGNVIVARDDLDVLLREELVESLVRGILMRNSQSPEGATRAQAVPATIRPHNRLGEGRTFMHLKRVVTLVALVAAAAILGKAGVAGNEWFNFTW